MHINAQLMQLHVNQMITHRAYIHDFEVPYIKVRRQSKCTVFTRINVITVHDSN